MGSGMDANKNKKIVMEGFKYTRCSHSLKDQRLKEITQRKIDAEVFLKCDSLLVEVQIIENSLADFLVCLPK